MGDRLDEQVRHAVDKDTMHRLLDNVPEGKTAVLIVDLGEEITFHYTENPRWSELFGVFEVARALMQRHWNRYQSEPENED